MWGDIALGLVGAAILGKFVYHLFSYLIHPEPIEDGAGSGWGEDENLRD